MTDQDYWVKQNHRLKLRITEALYIFHEILKDNVTSEDLRLKITKWRNEAEDDVDSSDSIF